MSGCLKDILRIAGAFLLISVVLGAVIYFAVDYLSSFEVPAPDTNSPLSASQVESRITTYIEDNEEGVRVVNLERGVLNISFYAQGSDEDAMVDLICYLQSIEPRMPDVVIQMASFDENTIGEAVGSLPVAEWVLIVDPTRQEVRDYDCSEGAPELRRQVGFVDAQ